MKYEEIYFKVYNTVSLATQGIGDWKDFYIQDRRHASLDKMTTDQVCSDLLSDLS